jgi:transcriptional regulator with XRE-family HTH domain
LELDHLSDFDLSPQRAAGIRRAETLARKINLLLDVIVSDTGKPFDYPAIRDGAQQAGYYLSRTRWSLLKSGREQVVPDEALRAIASVFDVDPEYLIQDGGKLPERVEAELALIRSMRRAEVRNFAARALGPVDPEALQAIAKILDEGV